MLTGRRESNSGFREVDPRLEHQLDGRARPDRVPKSRPSAGRRAEGHEPHRRRRERRASEGDGHETASALDARTDRVRSGVQVRRRAVEVGPEPGEFARRPLSGGVGRGRDRHGHERDGEDGGDDVPYHSASRRRSAIGHRSRSFPSASPSSSPSSRSHPSSPSSPPASTTAPALQSDSARSEPFGSTSATTSPTTSSLRPASIRSTAARAASARRSTSRLTERTAPT